MLQGSHLIQQQFLELHEGIIITLEKIERFAVISGKASIQLRKVDSEEVIEYILDGEHPAYVDMPIWYTHNITKYWRYRINYSLLDKRTIQSRRCRYIFY